MAKNKTSVENTIKKLEGYKFDSSNFIVLNSRVFRDASSGKLMRHDQEIPQKKRETA